MAAAAFAEEGEYETDAASWKKRKNKPFQIITSARRGKS
jgi:hypothetical protein